VKCKYIVIRINAIEQEAQAVFSKLRDRLNSRLSDENDALEDYEIDVVVIAKALDNNILHRSTSNILLFDKEGLDDEYQTIYRNDFSLDVSREKCKYHSFLYHDLMDNHAPQSDEDLDKRVIDIHHIDMEVTIWEQFRQQGTDIQGAIKIVKENLPDHAVARLVLTDKVLVPDVKISAYMYDDDPDAGIEDIHEKRDGVEDPFEGVIKYYDLDYSGDMPKEVAARTEFLFTDITSDVVLTFKI